MRIKLFAIFVVALCVMGITGSALAQELLLNPGFETWTAGAGGPPDNWSLSGINMTATQESGTIHGGTYSVNTTWTTTSTRWLLQRVVVVGDQSYDMSAWAYDNDPDGRGRLAIRWFDSAGVNVGAWYGTNYTEDSATWQQLVSGSQTAPATAETAHVELRLYDVTGWDGNATIYWDDASFQVGGPPPPPDTLSIYDIQYNETTAGSGNDCYPSPEQDSTVVVEGVVTALGRDYGDNFYIQDADSLWSGIFCYNVDFFPLRGDRVRFTAQVSEYYGLTELSNIIADSDTILSSGNPMPAILDLTPADLKQSCDAGSEAYEGMLVRIQNVTCVQEADEYGQWYVTDGTDTCEVEDGCWHYDPSVGEQFDYIVGVVTWSFLHYEINPRDEYDIPPRPVFTGISHTPTLPNSSQPVSVMASITETGTKAITADSIYYKLNTTGAWTKAAGDGFDGSYYNYTIPAIASDDDTVFFYLSADNGASVKTSPMDSILVLDEPPVIMINEIMYDSPSTDVSTFVELYGAPGLPLAGYSLVGTNGNDGYEYVTIDLTGSIPGDRYFVIGQDAGVANVDTITAQIDLQNGPDNLQLRKGGFKYDAVGYGTFDAKEWFVGETWPAYDPSYPNDGSSIGRDPDAGDSDYNRADFGVYGIGHTTPGTANTAAASYTIKQIQEGSKASPHLGERVYVTGVVTLDPVECPYNPGYYIEESSGGGWSGVLIYDLFNEPTRGDEVTVYGTVQEEYNRTQIGYITGYANGGPSTLPDPVPVFTAEVAVAESLEGVLVEVHSVTVVDTFDYGEFTVTDGAVADTCWVDDNCDYAYSAVPGDAWAVVRGVVDFSYGRYKIQPRDDDDLLRYEPSDLVAYLEEREAKSDSGDIYLEWTDVGIANEYVIYRSTDPEAMGDSLAEVAAPGDNYTDEDVVGDTGTNYYYMVQARYGGGAPTNSAQVGEFDKAVSNVK
jgi:hypothetical protein